MDPHDTPQEGSAQAVARLELPEKTLDLPIVKGTEGELALDISELRTTTGYITLDPGFSNTGSCTSTITFIDGEQGILRYRGYPIEQVANNTSFSETALLLLNGTTPNLVQTEEFSRLLTDKAMLHEGLRHHFEGFPPDAHPMAILSAMINATGCYHPELLRTGDEDHLLAASASLLSKVRTIAAFSYKKSRGEPIIYPDPARDYCNNFLHMMFSLPYAEYDPTTAVVRALRLFLILHADHEQNCSTATARMVGSAGANLFASVAAAVCALWGPLHGGANTAVINMLRRIHEGGDTVAAMVERVKRKEDLLWGFGHAVYKNFDPRVNLLRQAAKDLLEEQSATDPLLDIAYELERVALEDSYFAERRLYPNVDFYSGILLRAIGIPVNMFTVMFAIGRMPGWIAQWAEAWRNRVRLHRPRQIYVGPEQRSFVPIGQR
jgi:citrate synthase